ncbi:MAG: peptide/nickel transport system substrate-binding protein, partial [Chloroflexota bacterium]|nr:peptide/nickel transport system substrate-binding protein [Chloroflexota bacterium]
MTRTRSRRRSATLLLVVSALVGQACGEPSKPSTSGQASASQPVPSTASAGAFTAIAYPLDGDAPCNQVQAPDAAHAAYAGSIRRIRSIDAQTVEFQLCAPDVAFRTQLAFAAFAINDSGWLQSHVDAGRGNDQAIVQQVNGTGPYRLESWNRGSDITLVRNDSYWGLPARNERVVVRWRDDAAGRMDELRSGSVDGIDEVAAGDAEAVANDVSLKAVPRAGLNTFYVGFNSAYAPFDNPKVRQAIAIGIDRERIVQALYPPGSEVATHFSPCAIPYGCGGDPWYQFDAPAARQMLIAAG